CAKKQDELFNKPAVFWYEQIIKDIKDRDLEAADLHFTSMSSEHVASPMLEEAMLILANAHIEDEAYIMANFYLDEYIKRYGTPKRVEYASFLKIRANFKSFAYPNRNQQLLIDTIKDTRAFIERYPQSVYRPMVETILTKMELGEYYLNEEIASLYKRTKKKEAAAVYREKLENSPLKDAQMIKPKTPWHRKLFE
ncbi:MAG: outer membrane protein assembly factor BamD, partial [Campylobacteraceae bacterium]|nr:outer membrane protein assembly factor BamD [Campylobacteraceae bacterium]